MDRGVRYYVDETVQTKRSDNQLNTTKGEEKLDQIIPVYSKFGDQFSGWD